MKDVKPEKDNWDKADIIAKFLSSVVIAAFGLYFTNSIQNAQFDFSKTTAARDSTLRQIATQSDIKLRQATLTGQLISHLTAKDPNQRQIAIIALKDNLSNETYENILKIVASNDESKGVRLTALTQLDKPKTIELKGKKGDITSTQSVFDSTFSDEFNKQSKMIVSNKVGMGLNVRALPTTTSPIVAKLQPGEIVYVISEHDDWVQVSKDLTEKGIIGYAPKPYLIKL